MVHKLYEAKPEPKEIWILPSVEHANAYWDHTDEYVERVSKFVGRYIN